MADIRMGDFQGLESMQRAFLEAGDQHITIDSSGQLTRSTKGEFGRFFDRVASRLSKTARAKNEQTIATLKQMVTSLGAIPGSFAAGLILNKKVDLMPLSGREIAKVIESAIDWSQTFADMTNVNKTQETKERKRAAKVERFAKEYIENHKQEILPRLLAMGKFSTGQMITSDKTLIEKITNNFVGACTREIKSVKDAKDGALEKLLDNTILVVANSARQEIVNKKSLILFAAGDVSGGLTSALEKHRTEQERAFPFDAKGVQSLGKALVSVFVQDYKVNGQPLPHADGYGQFRDQLVDNYVQNTRRWLAMAYPNDVQAQHLALACLPNIRPELQDMAVTMAQAVRQTLGNAFSLTSAEDLETALSALSNTVSFLENEAIENNPGVGLGSDDFEKAQSFAISFAVRSLAEEVGMDAVAATLAAPDSPFIDLAYDLRNRLTGERDDSLSLLSYVENIAAVVHDMPGVQPEYVTRLGSDSLSINSTSLRYQRQKLGNDNVLARGATNDFGMNGTLPGIANQVQTALQTVITDTTANKPPAVLADPRHSDWECDPTLVKDMDRVGMFVNGRYLNGDVDGFIGSLPDRRTAAQLSSVFSQMIPGAFLSAPDVTEAFLTGTVGDMNLAGGRQEFSLRLETLDAPGGVYRLSYEGVQMSREEREQAVGRGAPQGYRQRIAFTVHTGVAPSVTNCTTDFLLFGWDEE